MTRIIRPIYHFFRRIHYKYRARRIAQQFIAANVPVHQPKLDGKFHQEDYTIAYCCNCNEDRVVYSVGLTHCKTCGAILFPCSACTECSYSMCLYDSKFLKFSILAKKLIANEDISSFEYDKYMEIHQQQEKERWDHAIQAGELPF